MSRIIKIGVYTDGRPDIEVTADGHHLLRNLLIGRGYHWQQTVAATLPGRVEIVGDREDGVGLFNYVDLETYIECVVGSEMNPNAPLELVKAHAVISRTWLMRMLSCGPNMSQEGKVSTPNMVIGWDDATDHTDFDVCSDDHCQRYQGVQDVPPGFSEAVRETRGLVIVGSDGVIADCRYSKCCGGVTERFSTCWQPVDYPYLPVQEDKSCDLSDLPQPLRRRLLSVALKNYDSATSDFMEWERTVKKSDIGRWLREKLGRDIGEILAAEAVERGPSGRIMILRLTGTEGSLLVGKELLIRRLFSPTHLYSSAFDIEDNGDTLTLRGHGWGHGVGLCQIGAARMAFEGTGYRDILSFYYPGGRLEIRD